MNQNHTHSTQSTYIYMYVLKAVFVVMCALVLWGASAVLQVHAATTTVVYSASTTGTSFNVPLGVTSITVKTWGAGGGGAGLGTAATGDGGNGAGGGFSQATISVTPGQNLTVRVGGGGGAGATVDTYGTGGGGGGYSGVFNGSTPLIIAGGGGGGGGGGGLSTASHGGRGGAGGASTGEAGQLPVTPGSTTGGGGGTQSAGGAAGTNGAAGENPVAGSSLAGGKGGGDVGLSGGTGGVNGGGTGGSHGADTQGSGGGGGGGYYGAGGGGRGISEQGGAGGGGGANYVTGAATTSTQASTQTAANTGDTDYAGGAGTGGTGATTGSATNGSEGLVVISYQTPATAGTISGTLYADSFGSTTVGAGVTLHFKYGTNATTSTTTTSGGAWTFDVPGGGNATTSMLVYVNGSSTFVSNTYLTGLGGGSGAAGIPMYKDTLIVMSTSSAGEVDLDNLSFFDHEDDGDVLYAGYSTSSNSYSTTTIYADFLVYLGTVIAPDRIEFQGDFTNYGTWTHASGTVDINGGLASLGGFDLNTTAYTNRSFSVAAQGTQALDVMFRPDGYMMYTIGYTDAEVNQYSLSRPYDVTSASYVATFSVNSQENLPSGVAFGGDGMKMFVVGYSGDDVNEYSLTVPWSISTATFKGTFSFVAQETEAEGIEFNPDGTKMFIVGVTGDKVYRYDLTAPFDVSTASFHSSVSVASQDTTPDDVAFSPDGRNMFMIGFTNGRVYEYELSTPYDLSTVSYIGAVTISTQESIPHGLAFHRNGSRMYVVGSANNTVYEYTLEAPFDVVTTYKDTYVLNAAETAPESIQFSNDGTKLFVVGTTLDRVARYDLTTAYDVTTASLHSSSSLATEQIVNAQGIAFNSDGTKIFFSDGTNSGPNQDPIAEYSMSTPYDLTTLTFTASTSVLAQEPAVPGDIEFNNDGTKLFLVGQTSAAVYEYTLSTAYTISTLSFVDSFSVSGQDTAPNGLEFSNDGTKMFVVGNTSDEVNEYRLSTPFDVSTAVFDNVFSVASEQTEVQGIQFNADGTVMHIVGKTGVEVNQYTLPEKFEPGNAVVRGNATGTSAFHNVIFTGDGTHTFGGNASTTGDFGIYSSHYASSTASTTVDAPAMLTVGGDFYSDGIFSADQGTVVFAAGEDATVEASPSATLTATSSFADVTVAMNDHFENDGVTWDARTAAGDNDSWSDITYGNGLFVAVGTSGDRVMTSPDGINWTARSAAGDNDSWYGVTYGNGLFVAVAVSGGLDRVMTSPDGINWTARSAAGDNDSWNTVTYGNGLFVAVGDSGDRVMTSPDGITWTVRTAVGDNDSWQSITYGNGLFVAVGQSSDRVMTSPDGINWTARSAAGDNDSWQSITYGNGLFAAVGNSGDRVMTSPDGITWTVRTAAGDDDTWYGITYGNGLFVTMGVGVGTDRVMTSPDGITWTVRTAAGNNDQWYSGIYGNSLFVVVGSGLDYVITSSSGTFEDSTLTFNDNASTSDFAINSGSVVVAPPVLGVGGDFTQNGTFTAGSGRVEMTGLNDTTPTISGTLTGTNGFTDLTIGSTTANDGVTWTVRSAAAATIWQSITYGNGIFVAVALSGTNRVMTSPDGITWTARSAAAANLWQSITYGNGLFVAVAYTGTNRVMTSPDGITWTARSAAAANPWQSITYGNGTFVAVSDDGTDRVMTSPDGITWTARSAAEANEWQSITYGNGIFVAVALSGTNRVMTSPDGVTWTARAATEANSWKSITYGNGTFVAVADSGTNRVMTSPDGINWTARSAAGNDDSWKSITYGNGLFIAVGNTGADVNVMTSPDGITWTGRSAAGNNDYWNDITYGNDLFVAVGSNLTTDYLMTSSSTSLWPVAATLQSNASTSDVTVAATSTLIAPSGALTITGDYTNNGTFSNNGGTVYFGDATTSPRGDEGFDISTTSLASMFSTTATTTIDARTEGITFNASGTKMFTVGQGSDKVYSFDLARAWDLSTASQTASTSVSTQDTQPTDLAFNSDGTRLFIVGGQNDKVYRYDPGSAYNISSLTFHSSTSVASQDTEPTGLALSTDGTNMFITGDTNNRIFRYTLPMAFELGTSTFHSSTSVSAEDIRPQSIRFNGDGTRMFMLGASTTSEVNSYLLSTAYDITATSLVQVFSVVDPGDIDVTGLAFSPDGTRMFITGSSSDAVFGYNLIDQTATGTATGTSAFNHVTFAGDNVTKFNMHASTSNITIQASSTFVAPRELTIAGNYANSGTFTPSSGTTTFSSTTAQTISGTLTATSSMGNLVFDGSGAKTFSAQATTTNLSINSGATVVAPTALTIQGNYANSGTLTAGSGIVYLSPTTTATTTHSGTITGTSKFNDVVLTGSRRVDGATWTARTDVGGNIFWDAIAYGAGRFVAVANGVAAVTTRIMTSTDAITWNAANITVTNTWYGITYGNGQFVAVAASSTSANAVARSSDGLAWTTHTPPGGAISWKSVAYGNGLYVAVADSGASRAMTSSDGITWTTQTAAGSDDAWKSVTFGNGLFVAVGGATDRVMTSSDGASWTARSAAGNDDTWQSVTFGNGLFVAVGSGATDYVMTSPDGTTWTTRSVPETNSWSSVVYGDGLFVAVSGDGTNRVMTSPDGINWTARTAAAANTWTEMTYGNGIFVAVANDNANSVMTSSSTSPFPTVQVFGSNASTSNFTIASSSSTTAPARLTITGNYTNEGTFNANFGTTTFAGAGTQIATGTLSATSSFYNLEVLNTSATTTFGTTTTVQNVFTSVASTTVALPAGATTTVAKLNLVGTANREVKLRSTTQDTQAKLAVTQQLTVVRVNVRDSDACPGMDITATQSTDSGNNTCWTISGSPTGGSANQTFALGQATTSIQTITVTEPAAPVITSANDIRIAIATSTHDMRWDTFDTTATFGGTASGKVSGTVSYEGSGAVLVINVTSDFAASDTLTISGLSFAQFASATPAASALNFYFDGTNDTDVDATDSGTVTITGTLTAGEHDAGQAGNIFSYQNVTTQPLYRFKLTPNGESATVGTLTLTLSAAKKVDDTNLTNLALYRDYDSDGIVNGSDEAVGGTGAFVISGQTGTITFSTPWSATTTQNYIVVADTVALKAGSRMDVTLNVTGTVTGVTSLTTFAPTGSVTSSRHERGGVSAGNGGNPNLGSSGAVGGDAPPGQATTTGGGDTGGEEIGSTPGFQAPQTSGAVFNEWTSGANGIASDGAYATAASTNLRQSYSVFGFNVPSGNTVEGIEVKLEASGSTAAGTIEVALSWNGDSTVTATKATSVLTGSDVVYTLGGPADNWGRTWAPSEFGDANFFVRVIAQPNSNTVRVDAIQVKPYHQAGGGGAGGGGEI